MKRPLFYGTKSERKIDKNSVKISIELRKILVVTNEKIIWTIDQKNSLSGDHYK